MLIRQLWKLVVCRGALLLPGLYFIYLFTHELFSLIYFVVLLAPADSDIQKSRMGQSGAHRANQNQKETSVVSQKKG